MLLLACYFPGSKQQPSTGHVELGFADAVILWYGLGKGINMEGRWNPTSQGFMKESFSTGPSQGSLASFICQNWSPGH